MAIPVEPDSPGRATGVGPMTPFDAATDQGVSGVRRGEADAAPEDRSARGRQDPLPVVKVIDPGTGDGRLKRTGGPILLGVCVGITLLVAALFLRFGPWSRETPVEDEEAKLATLDLGDGSLRPPDVPEPPEDKHAPESTNNVTPAPRKPALAPANGPSPAPSESQKPIVYDPQPEPEPMKPEPEPNGNAGVAIDAPSSGHADAEGTPPPEAEPDAAEIARFRDMLRSTVSALAKNDYATSKRSLADAEALARLEAQQAQVVSLQALAGAAEDFHNAILDTISGLRAGSSLEVRDGQYVGVVDVTPTALILRIGGKNKPYSRENLDLGLAAVLGETGLGRDRPETLVRKAAYVALNPQADAEVVQKARGWLVGTADRSPEAKQLETALDLLGGPILGGRSPSHRGLGGGPRGPPSGPGRPARGGPS
jgi:hypothetical protein